MSGTRSARRPRSVTFLIWGVSLIGVWNLMRALALSRGSSALQNLDITPKPMVVAVFSLLWSIAFITSAVAIWKRFAWTRFAVPTLLLTYGLYNGLLLGIYGQGPLTEQKLILSIVSSVTFIILATWILNRRTTTIYLT